jgi:translation initiation factor IF-3
MPRANGEITVPEVRLIDQDGEMVGVVKLQEALERAKAVSLDLVELSPGAEPPVCRILDFGKYKFQMQRKAQEGKKKQKTVQVKEIKLRPNIDKHDYEVKLRSIHKFLDQGDKVKITLRFRGREITHADLGMDVMNRILSDVGELAKVDSSPRIDGRQIIMVISPR